MAYNIIGVNGTVELDPSYGKVGLFSSPQFGRPDRVKVRDCTTDDVNQTNPENNFYSRDGTERSEIDSEILRVMTSSTCLDQEVEISQDINLSNFNDRRLQLSF